MVFVPKKQDSFSIWIELCCDENIKDRRDLAVVSNKAQQKF